MNFLGMERNSFSVKYQVSFSKPFSNFIVRFHIVAILIEILSVKAIFAKIYLITRN